MKKRNLVERLRYWFDCIMSRGPIAMTILLLTITVTIVGVIGLVAFFVADEGSLGYQIWMSLMHSLDAGTLAGNTTDNIPYVILMCLATLSGLFVTSMLIGIIATGVENKFNELRRGTSIVQEQNHTVIIGFDNSIFVLLHELLDANANRKKATIVILGVQPKEEMEEIISARIPETGTTRIICRSGSLYEEYSFRRCAVEHSHSVIINIHDDAETIKTILALSTYIRDKELMNHELRFITEIQDKHYVEAASIAGEGRTEIVYTKDAIARIIANTCRQHGLSQVLTELFNFDGNELYFEDVPNMDGKTFQEALLSFSNAMVVGVCSGKEIQLNPPMNTIIGKNDKLILLEEDDGAYNIHEIKKVDTLPICDSERISAQASNHLVILGSNDKLPIILSEYDKYVCAGSKVVVVDDDMDYNMLSTYKNLEIIVRPQLVTKELLSEFLEEGVNNILLLNDNSKEPEASDSQTLLYLILLRDIADKTKRHLAITTEMRSVDNQRLAAQARVDDFVIGSNFTSLLMAQISENYMLTPLFADLLDENGSELYMKPVTNYVSIEQPVNGYTLTESAARKGEIYVGYRHVGKQPSHVIVNPNKNDRIMFDKGDQIVVIAEN